MGFAPHSSYAGVGTDAGCAATIRMAGAYVVDTGQPIQLEEIARAPVDSGIDALGVEGMPEMIALESAEAALLAAGFSLGLWLIRHRREWSSADADRRRALLREGLHTAGLGALSGAGLSLVLSIALALVPGGQIWLAGLGVMAVVRALPSCSGDPFDLSGYARGFARER